MDTKVYKTYSWLHKRICSRVLIFPAVQVVILLSSTSCLAPSRARNSGGLLPPIGKNSFVMAWKTISFLNIIHNLLSFLFSTKVQYLNKEEEVFSHTCQKKCPTSINFSMGQNFLLFICDPEMASQLAFTGETVWIRLSIISMLNPSQFYQYQMRPYTIVHASVLYTVVLYNTLYCLNFM